MVEKDKIIQLENDEKFYVLNTFNVNDEEYLELIKLNEESNEIIGESFGAKYIENNGIIGISIMSNLDFAEIKQ